MVLLDGLMVRVYMELMNHHFWVDPSHISMCPSEAVMMLLEELDECRAKVGFESSTNLNFMIWQV